MSDDEKALALVPEVNTLARPASKVLLAARHEMNRNSALRDAFVTAREMKAEGEPNVEEVLTEVVVDALYSTIKGEEPEIREVARYLVDEYFQIGDSMLLVSTETGLPIAKLTEKDLWQPPPTMRESGKLVQPNPRLRPDLEGLLIRSHHDDKRERKLLSELSSRVLQTDFLKGNDIRLATITREGRSQFMGRLREDLSSLFPHKVGGVSGQFLAQFSFAEPESTKGLTEYRGLTAFTRAPSISLVDHKARNFKFDQGGSVRASVAVGWVKSIAGKIAELAQERGIPEPIDFATYDHNGLVWVAGGPTLAALYRCGIGPTLPLNDDIQPYAMTGLAGYIVPREYGAKSRVIHDRWQIAATMDFDLWIDWGAIEVLNFSDLPVEVFAAEVVQ